MASSPNSNGAPIKQGEERFRRLVEGVQKEYVIYGNDLEGRLTYVSPSIKAVLGYEPEDVIGRNWREFVTDPQSLASAEQHQAMAFQGLDTPPNVVEVTHADGGSRLLEVLPSPVYDDAGQVIGVEGICKDVTRLKQAEQELIRATEDLDRRVRQRTAELERRLRFEELLVALSTRFVNLPAAEIDDGLVEALRRIGEFTDVDRCFIYEFDEPRAEASLTHEWVAAGVPSVKDRMQRVPTGNHQWLIEQFSTVGALHVPDVEKLPPDAAALKRLYGELGVRSVVNVPMLSGGKLIGMLGFVSVRRSRVWRQDEIELLVVLAEVLVNALDRQRAEAALRESEARYRAIVEDQVDMIVRWLPDGTHTFVNEAVCRLHKKPLEEVLSMSIFEGIHPDDIQQVRDKFASLTPEKPFAADEHRVVRADGSVIWMQWIDRAMFDAQGKPVEYQSIGRDITDLRVTQEKLEARLDFERLVQSLTTRLINLPTTELRQGIDDGLRLIGEFTGVDRSYVFLFDDGFTHAEVAHQWSRPGAPPMPESARRIEVEQHGWALEKLLAGKEVVVDTIDDLPSAAAGWGREMRDTGLRSFTYVPMMRRGRLVGFLGFASLEKERCWSDDDISLLRLSGEIIVSVMQREQAERAMRTSEERLRMTVEALEHGFYDWNVQTGEVYYNDILLRSFGLPEGHNNGHYDDWQTRVDPRDWSRVEESLSAHLRGETPVFELEYRRIGPDGEPNWNFSRGRVVARGENGEPLRMLGVDRDVTDLVKQRQERRELESQLAHLGRVATMGETVAGIAHEVNQPLHAAATFSAAAGRALVSGQGHSEQRAAQMIHRVSEQIARAGDIIHRLREFTRPQPAKLSPIDLNDVVRDSAALIAHVMTRREARTVAELDESLPPVLGDPVQLQQVVVNLLQNAYEAVGQGVEDPVVSIRTKAGPGRVEVSVSDNGVAPPPADPEELFDAFVTSKPDGMGIGLTLCRTILEAHQGKINVAANPGPGLTFTISVPVAERGAL